MGGGVKSIHMDAALRSDITTKVVLSNEGQWKISFLAISKSVN